MEFTIPQKKLLDCLNHFQSVVERRNTIPILSNIRIVSEGKNDNLIITATDLALELSEADHVVTPTAWQRSQLPASLQKRCEVIHEGVDTDFFVMNPTWRPKNRLRLTYATRGMEPMRGFPQFVRD